MAVEMHEIEVWVLVNQCGDMVASHDADLLNDLFEEHVQPVSECEGTRRIKIKLIVPLPAVIEVTGEVAVNEECGELKAA